MRLSWRKWAWVGTALSIAIVLVVFSHDIWQRRWISDDGLIYVRTVRQILAGNGPTFNTFERAEADTSVLWTYLLTAAGWLSHGDPSHWAVLLGAVLSVTALGIAMDATRRLLVQHGSHGIMLPAGVLIVLAAYPFWDFATSGLETGLCFAWLAVVWWLLVTLRAGRELTFAVVVGLGTLVRPDLAVVSAVFLVVGWLVMRPSRRDTLLLLGAAAALPFAYEVFRAGYYGTLVPLPALAKSASASAWKRGWGYLIDFERPYRLWLPAAVIAALATFVLLRRRLSRAEIRIALAPVIAAAIWTLYVLRVGGDFMHARMLLGPAFLVVFPVLLVPLRLATAPALAVLTVWTVLVVHDTADGNTHATVPPIEDERVGYTLWTGKHHPIDARGFIAADAPASRPALDGLAHGQRKLYAMGGFATDLAPSAPSNLVYAAGRLGTSGAVLPLDTIAADTLGLANPLGARITPTLPGYTGHEKPLPMAWLFADFADPKAPTGETSPDAIRAARHALSCGDLAELLASVREPMTVHRFFANLVGSVRRTRLVIPSDPFEAEKLFCGHPAQ